MMMICHSYIKLPKRILHNQGKPGSLILSVSHCIPIISHTVGFIMAYNQQLCLDVSQVCQVIRSYTVVSPVSMATLNYQRVYDLSSVFHGKKSISFFSELGPEQRSSRAGQTLTRRKLRSKHFVAPVRRVATPSGARPEKNETNSK